jgi:glycosyltransferase involved in cell wall biosynthesis
MLDKRDVVIISSIDWDFNWQGPQEIALRLAESGNRVFFVENLGVRAPQLKDLPRVVKRLKKWVLSNLAFWRESHNKSDIPNNLFVFSPLAFPPFSASPGKKLNRSFFIPKIKAAIQRQGFDNVVILTFIPSDTVNELIDQIRDPDSTIVYYSAADFPKLVKNPESMRAAEVELIKNCDAVFTICNPLTKDFSEHNHNVHTICYGVDIDAFDPTSKKDELTRAVIETYARNEKPVIGYVGGLHQQVDFELLKQCALSRPDWNWVFVGPIQENIAELESLPNTFFLGQQPHSQLVHFIDSFDVCLIPYLDNDFTQTVVPVKLNEYLAVGKPVVSTNIPIISEFESRHPMISICEHNTADFLSAIEKNLATEQTKEMKILRRAIASRYEWQLQLEKICHEIEKVST